LRSRAASAASWAVSVAGRAAAARHARGAGSRPRHGRAARPRVGRDRIRRRSPPVPR
jgi:hypothetical protein